MLNALKALVVVLPIIIAVFVAGRFVFRDHVDPARITRWTIIFVSITIFGFLIPNFWIMIVLYGAIMLALVGLKIETNIPVLYVLVICCLPPQFEPLLGFAGINYLFDISPPMILSLTLLVPALLYFKSMKIKGRGIVTTDIFMFSFFLLAIILGFRSTTFTNGLREVWNVGLTIFLPYLIFSRWIKDVDELKTVIIAIMLPMISMACIAFFEAALQWHFYSQPAVNWHGDIGGKYGYRAGFLRAFASVMGPIEFGFLLMITMTFAYSLYPRSRLKFVGAGAIAAMFGALMLTFSRGPWIGVVIATFTYVSSGPKGFKNAMIAGAVSVVLFAGVLVSPIGNSVISVLPFVDSGDSHGASTITYRQQLLENGIIVVKRNPLFGSTDYYQQPEMQALIQGEGIIDIVNSYLQVALQYGLVGMTLFIGILMSATFAAWRAMRLSSTYDEELSTYSRAMFAAMVGVMVVIGTTSSVLQVPIFYWFMAGLCVAVRRIVATDMQTAAKTGTETQHLKVGVDPTNSLRVAQEKQEQSAEEIALAKRNAERKREARARTVPAHLRQYVRNKPPEPRD